MDRCGGPGLVCRSLDIDRSLNGAALAPPAIYVLDDGYRFLNYSADASSYVPARPGPSKVLENPVPFSYMGDGDDYIAPARTT